MLQILTINNCTYTYVYRVAPATWPSSNIKTINDFKYCIIWCIHLSPKWRSFIDLRGNSFFLELKIQKMKQNCIFFYALFPAFFHSLQEIIRVLVYLFAKCINSWIYCWTYCTKKKKYSQSSTEVLQTEPIEKIIRRLKINDSNNRVIITM